MDADVRSHEICVVFQFICAFIYSRTNLAACDPCLTPGHVCDSHSGRCECPANVEGDLCTKCTVGYWGNPRYGCKVHDLLRHGLLRRRNSPSPKLIQVLQLMAVSRVSAL